MRVLWLWVLCLVASSVGCSKPGTSSLKLTVDSAQVTAKYTSVDVTVTNGSRSGQVSYPAVTSTDWPLTLVAVLPADASGPATVQVSVLGEGPMGAITASGSTEVVLVPGTLVEAMVRVQLTSGGPSDLGAPSDLAVGRDLAPSDAAATADLTTPMGLSDLATPQDLHVPSDLPLPGDLGAPNDLSVPDDLAVPSDQRVPDDLTMGRCGDGRLDTGESCDCGESGPLPNGCAANNGQMGSTCSQSCTIVAPPDLLPPDYFDWARWPVPHPAAAGLPTKTSYTVKTDTVVDHVTGLEWERSPLNKDYTWSSAGEPGSAQAHCAQLNKSGPGWRIPSLLELLSIVDVSRPGLPYVTAPFVVENEAGTYWTATPHARSTDVWVVQFGAGIATPLSNGNNCLVRCVRPQPSAPPGEHYTLVNGDVRDNWTGRIWQKEIDSTKRNHADAVSYCTARGPGWRLPSIYELVTLVDVRNRVSSQPTHDVSVFGTALPAETSAGGRVDFWSGSEFLNLPDRARTLDFSRGTTDFEQFKTSNLYARCVFFSDLTCGNGIVDTGEECDDGNADETDACVSCRNAVCGDGKVRSGTEECDDGNGNDTDGCTNDCKLPVCGNGVTQAGEACDDGNADETDACVSCQNAVCGDGKVRSGTEECDDGNGNDTDGCTNDCKLPVCGNGVIQAGEACDDGTLNGQHGKCKVDCTGLGERCGDGVTNGPELCDNGAQNGQYDKCKVDCTGLGERCGDGVTNGPELCDNGAQNGQYGKCKVGCAELGERCGDGVTNGPELCDDGAQNGQYGKCKSDCTGLGERCGDGVKNGPEECDDGGTSSGDGCSADCVRESINLQLAQWPMPNPAGSELPRPALYTTVGTSVFDTVTGLEWEKDLSAQLFTWDPAAATGSAQSYCANLSKNGTGWRLPSKIELESLVDFTRVSPSLAPSFPSLGASGRFWSATPIATSGSTPLVWSVSFATGLAVPDSAGAGLSVRCVRSTTSSVPAARYTANVLANEVVDNATGLTWQEPMDLTRRTQPEARAYCPTLGTGWRAPTQKELLTLVDPRIASPGPTIDPTFFPLAPQDLVWSSSYAAGATGKGWAVNFGSGDASSSVNTTDTYSVRCVRSSATPTLPSREWALWPMPDASSFDTSSTEVIVDATTGLTWEKNVLNTIYSWGASAGTGTAQAYCTGLTTAGGGWRLPTKIELESVLDLTRNPPYYPAFDSTNSPKTVWTGTGVAGNANSAWAVSFDFQGVSGPTAIANRRHVRCVRSTPKASLAEHYSSAPSASGGGVTDIWTGLTWQASVDSTKRSHSDAETYCSTLGTGWRLPSVKELLTLVAATRKQPSIETLYFPSTPSDNFWTSTLNRTNPTTQAWYVNFTEGSSTATEPRSNLWLVRCVR